jgi:hypothetical protein
MTLRILIAAALIGFMNTAGALRVIEQVERPFEATVAQLALPGAATGTLTFRPCADCTFESHRMDVTTRFLVNRHEVPYADFVRAFKAAKGSEATAQATMANVYVDLATGRVTRLSLITTSAPAPRR